MWTWQDLHRDFSTTIVFDALGLHLAEVSHIDLPPCGFAWTKSMSFLQVMVSECLRGEPFQLAAGK